MRCFCSVQALGQTSQHAAISSCCIWGFTRMGVLQTQTMSEPIHCLKSCEAKFVEISCFLIKNYQQRLKKAQMLQDCACMSGVAVFWPQIQFLIKNPAMLTEQKHVPAFYDDHLSFLFLNFGTDRLWGWMAKMGWGWWSKTLRYSCDTNDVCLCELVLESYMVCYSRTCESNHKNVSYVIVCVNAMYDVDKLLLICHMETCKRHQH